MKLLKYLTPVLAFLNLILFTWTMFRAFTDDAQVVDLFLAMFNAVCGIMMAHIAFLLWRQ